MMRGRGTVRSTCFASEGVSMSAKRNPSIRIIWLKAFLVVADGNSVTETAKVLDVSQSTISRYLTDLEASVGRVLLTGDVPRELTEDGRKFRTVAKEVIELLDAWRPPDTPTS